jgi:outer membrane protein
MKNALLVLNAVLVIAVATLFFLYFNKKTTPLQASIVNNETAQSTNFKMAYFEMDSIENNYEYYKEVRNQLRGKEQQHNNDLQQIKNEYNQQLSDYSRLQGTLSQEDKMKREENLRRLEDTYKNKQQMQMDDLQSEGYKKMQEVSKRIQAFLKEYNRQKGFAYIFASNADLMYYKDSVYNITADLVKGLNAEYKKK